MHVSVPLPPSVQGGSVDGPLVHSSEMHGRHVFWPRTGRRADMKQSLHRLGSSPHVASGSTHASILHLAVSYTVPAKPACSARMMPYRPSRNSSCVYAHTMTPP